MQAFEVSKLLAEQEKSNPAWPVFLRVCLSAWAFTPSRLGSRTYSSFSTPSAPAPLRAHRLTQAMTEATGGASAYH